jgi:hypothetical protein
MDPLHAYSKMSATDRVHGRRTCPVNPFRSKVVCVTASEQKTDPVRTSVRFPLRLEVLIAASGRVYHALTRDVSANGVLFAADELPPVGSEVEFRLNMPAAVMGGTEDVVLHCTGRIVRHAMDGEEHLAGAVIDDYFLKVEQV